MEGEQRITEQKSTPAEAPANSAANPPTSNDVEKGSTKSNTNDNTEDSTLAAAESSNEVDWDGLDDPKNPLNWSQVKKWSTILLVSYITFVT
jgi:hypothetical protein